MTRRAIFRCDASATLGGGHVMRCLTLARALATRGWKIAFAVNDEAIGAVPALAASGFSVAPGFRMDADDAAKLRELADGAPFDLLVVDHYRVTPELEQGWRELARIRLAVDDFAKPSGVANPKHDCEMLLNTNIGAEAAAYLDRVPHGATILAGLSYALLRPEFADTARLRLANRAGEPPHIRRVVLSFGLTDLNAITARAFRLIRSIEPGLAIEAILGPNAPSLTELRAASDPNFALHIAPSDVAAIMARADLAIGAAGQSAYERCALGLPSIAVALAENQLFLVEGIAKAGAAIGITAFEPDWEDRMRSAFIALGHDGKTRLAMREAGLSLCDGRGAERVAEAIEAALSR